MPLTEPTTDPRAPGPLPPALVPSVVADARRAASEVRIACDDTIRACPSTRVRRDAERLKVQAIRLGQAANALSAVPVGEEGAILWIPPRLSFWRRVRVLMRFAWVVLTR